MPTMRTVLLVVLTLLLFCSLTAKAKQAKDLVIEIDLDDAPDTKYELTPWLRFGADSELQIEYEGNFDLDSKIDDDLNVFSPDVGIAFLFTPRADIQTLVEMQLQRAFLLESPEGKTRPETSLEIKQAYVTFQNFFYGLSLQLGRQDFDDDREWIYDKKFDAIRLHFRSGRFAAELAAGRELVVGKDLLQKDTKDRVNNFFFLARYAASKDVEIGAYVIRRDDRQEKPEDLTHIGVRSIGEITSDLEYWLDVAMVRGRDRGDEIQGHGFDVGGTYTWDVPFEPSLTFGYAFGSGDSNPDDDVDENFRQTGYQDNNDKFNGVTSFQYYGEVFKPELSNMSIWTVGIGIRPTKRSSIDLVYHQYRQVQALDDLRDVAIDLDPEGDSRFLGEAVDVIIGYKEIKDLKVEFVFGIFFPGRAFGPDADRAYSGGLEIKYDF